MKSRYSAAGVLVVAALALGLVRPAHAQAPAPTPHEAQMAAMQAADAKIDALVKKMNAAKGQAKIDAMAELLNAFVDHHKNMCEPMMMGGMMPGMPGMQGTPGAGPAKPAK